MEIHDKIVFKHNGVKLEYKPLNISNKYWLSNFEYGNNTAIFNLLGIEDRFAFCEKEIGYSIECKTADFPEVNSLEDLEKIVNALYKRIIEISTSKFQVGDMVMVVKREGKGSDYPCSYMDEMVQYENRIFTISKINKMSTSIMKSFISKLKYEEPFYYTLEGMDWICSSAMLRKVGTIKDLAKSTPSLDKVILSDIGKVNIVGVPFYIDTNTATGTYEAINGPSIYPEKEEPEYKLTFKFNHLKF